MKLLYLPANIPEPVPTSMTTLSLKTSGFPIIAAWYAAYGMRVDGKKQGIILYETKQ